MPSRREILAGMGATAGTGLTGLLLNHESGKSDNKRRDKQDCGKSSGRDKHRGALSRFEEDLEWIGDVELAQESHNTYVLGVDTGFKEDLYGVALSDYDNTFVNKDENEKDFRDIAHAVSSVGLELVEQDEVPNDNLTIYAGPTGRNKSLMPMKFDFETCNTFEPKKEAEKAYEDLKDQTGENIEEILPYQLEALDYLGGFDKSYKHNHLIGVVPNIDGMDNQWPDEGEFQMGHTYSEIEAVEDNSGGKPAAFMRFKPNDKGPIEEGWEYGRKEVGDSFPVRGRGEDYKLKVTFLDTDAEYMEAQVIKGDYGRLDAPFLQDKNRV